MAGTAARFDQASDRVSYIPGTDPPDSFTVTMWVYLAVDAGADTSLLRRYTSGGSGRGQIGTAVGSGTALTWWPSGVAFNHSLVVGQWTRLAVTVSGGLVATYAGQGAAGTITTNTGSSGTVAGANQVTLAGLSVGNAGQPANVRMAHIRTHPGLTQPQIEAEWASTSPVEPGMWAVWALTTDLNDTSGNARHLTAGSTAVTFTEDGPPIGEAPAFSGTVTLAAAATAVPSGQRASGSSAALGVSAAVAPTGAKTAAGTGELAASASTSLIGSRATTGAATLPATAGIVGAGTRGASALTPLPAASALLVSGRPARAGTVVLTASVVLAAGTPADDRDVTVTATLVPQGRVTATLGSRRWTAHLEAQP